MAVINLGIECLDNEFRKFCPGQLIHTLHLIHAYKPLSDILRPGFHDALGLCIVFINSIVEAPHDAGGPLLGLRGIPGADAELIREPAGHTGCPGLDDALGSGLLVCHALIESGHGVGSDAGQYG